MKSIFKILFSGLLILLFSSCASKNDISTEYNNAPSWVREPYLKGEITGLGISPPNNGADISLQRSESMAVARDEIARTIETKIGSFFDKFVESTGSKNNKKFSRDVKSKIRNVAKQKLRGARVRKSWMGKSGMLYTLMTLDTKKVLDILEEATSDLRDKDIQFQRFLSEKNLKELEKELEKYNN